MPGIQHKSHCNHVPNLRLIPEQHHFGEAAFEEGDVVGGGHDFCGVGEFGGGDFLIGI